jgi:hypothetical protein
MLPRCLHRRRLRPRRHAAQEHLPQRPDLVGQPRRHGGCLGLPALGRAWAVRRHRLQQRLAYTGLGQAEILVHVRQGQRLAYAVLALAERGNTPSHRRPRRTDGQGEALDARRGDLPAMGRQPWLERPEGADDDAGLHVAQAPAPPGLHHWRREEPGQGLLTLCQPQFVKFLPHLHDWLTAHAAGIIAGAMTPHGPQHPPQSVANMAPGLALALALRPHRRRHAVAGRVAVPRAL